MLSLSKHVGEPSRTILRQAQDDNALITLFSEFAGVLLNITGKKNVPMLFLPSDTLPDCLSVTG